MILRRLHILPLITPMRFHFRIRQCARLLLSGPLVSLPLPAGAQADAPSLSKLGLHLIGNYSAGAQQVSTAHPRILKILDTGGAMLAALRDFKARTPDGVSVLRIFTTRTYSVSSDPAVSGADFWNGVLAPAINGLSASDRALIDYVEGPNEGDSTPTWGSLADAQWYNNFWLALAPLIANAGFKPCAYSISVGNPPGSTTEVQQRLNAIAPSLRRCQELGGGWSITGVDESTWHFATVDPARLNAGTNILAAEVHQSSATSSDLSFDLALRAYSATDLAPPRTVKNGTGLYVSWPVAQVDLALFSSTDLLTWTRENAVPAASNNELSVTLSAADPRRLFRLQIP